MERLLPERVFRTRAPLLTVFLFPHPGPLRRPYAPTDRLSSMDAVFVLLTVLLFALGALFVARIERL